MAIIGFIGGYLDKNFSKDSKITIILMVIFSTFIYEILKYIMNIFILDFYVDVWMFLKILLIEILYNILLTIIFYPLIKKAGYYMENVIKGNAILTRYF